VTGGPRACLGVVAGSRAGAAGRRRGDTDRSASTRDVTERRKAQARAHGQAQRAWRPSGPPERGGRVPAHDFFKTRLQASAAISKELVIPVGDRRPFNAGHPNKRVQVVVFKRPFAAS